MLVYLHIPRGTKNKHLVNATLNSLIIKFENLKIR